MSYEDDIQIDDDGGYQRNRKVHPKAIQNLNDFDGDALGIATKSSAAPSTGENKDDGLFAAESDAAVQFGAVKPYIGAIVAPSKAPPNNPEAPDYSLSIDWVYGYRGYDSRSNLVWNGAREMVYPVAGVVVIHNAEKNAQRFFSGHNDDVTCLAQHPLNPNIIATGQVATIVNKKATLPHICIVDTVKKDIKVLKNVHKRAVRTLGFSADGRYLASVGDDNEQTVIVWDTETKQQVASEKGDTNKILYLRWSHKDPTEFVTVGKNHCYFWQFSASPAKLTKKRGRLGDRPQLTFHSVAFSERGYACVGGEDGQIYVFVKGECQKTFKVHEGPIFALDDYPGGLVSGGRDGKVVTLGADVKPIRIAAVPFGGGVRSVYVSGNDVLVGTDRGCICEFPNFTRQDVVSEPVVRSHWDGELWALAVHPDGRTFATAGEDNVVALWDMHAHKMVGSAVISEQKGKVLQGGPKASTTSRHPPNQCARAAAFSADGKVLAIGTNQGFFVAYSVVRTADSASLKQITSVDLNSYGQRNVVGQTENWIQTIQFSPDGKAIAVGTHGMVIVLLDTQTYTVKATMKAHHAAITHMDWSKDSTHIQSNCRAYELLFHDVNTKDFKCAQNPVAKALRDVDWKSQTCIFGWSVNGIFDPDMDGTDINSCDASPSRQLLVTGDDFGKVNLYRYPCLQSSNKRQVCAGHSSHVALVRFTPDEKFVISVGGEDKSIIQWRVNPTKK